MPPARRGTCPAAFRSVAYGMRASFAWPSHKCSSFATAAFFDQVRWKAAFWSQAARYTAWLTTPIRDSDHLLSCPTAFWILSEIRNAQPPRYSSNISKTSFTAFDRSLSAGKAFSSSVLFRVAAVVVETGVAPERCGYKRASEGESEMICDERLAQSMRRKTSVPCGPADQNAPSPASIASRRQASTPARPAAPRLPHVLAALAAPGHDGVAEQRDLVDLRFAHGEVTPQGLFRRRARHHRPIEHRHRSLAHEGHEQPQVAGLGTCDRRPRRGRYPGADRRRPPS